MTADSLRGRWIGDLRGTLFGNLFVEFEELNGEVAVRLRANVSGGVVAANGVIDQLQDPLAAKLIADEDPGTTKFNGELALSFENVSDSAVDGAWQHSDGNRGVFRIVRAASPSAEQQESAAGPLQIVQRTRLLPRFTIYRNELRDLANVIRELLPSENRVVIRSEIGGSDIRRYDTDFWEMAGLPRRVPYFHISLNDPRELRSINISLTPTERSLTVSSGNEMWTNGAFFKLDSLLSGRGGFWRDAFEKYGLTVNAFVLLLALVLGPGLDTPSRFALTGAAIMLMIAFALLHRQVTQLRIFVREDFQHSQLIDIPRVATTIVGAAVLGLVAWAYQLLSTGGLRPLLEWLGILSSVPAG